MPEISNNSKKKIGFWEWMNDNPTTFIMVLLIFGALVAVVWGYKEGFATITGGLIGVLRGSDAENKQKLEEAKRRTDESFSAVRGAMDSMKAQQDEHDADTDEVMGSAKAEVDSYDVDQLIDEGRKILEMQRGIKNEKGE